MGVQCFGQFLIDRGEVDASQIREALLYLDSKNPTLGEVAVSRCYMSARDVARVNAEQRIHDTSFGGLAVEMGLLEEHQLVEIVQDQRSQGLAVGEALVFLGYLAEDDLGDLLDAHKADQSEFKPPQILLPDELDAYRIAGYVLELIPRVMMRVARMQIKVGDVHASESAPDFTEFCVSLPVCKSRGLEVGLVSDYDFAEALAREASGLKPCDFDAEMIADGVGEFLNVLCGNAASALAQEYYRVELGPPNVEAHFNKGWVVELASSVGRAAVVFSTS